ncbi:uncharacterized protein LOC105630464 isoform X2 [Jatropha curcas]|nr:uncharacterized protein LOC105630464 isoform X2 [Jatropha curcas]XP_012067678.1 uncharacterized protein LOC105630464 isoform X2 [Jatropha curcas]
MSSSNMEKEQEICDANLQDQVVGGEELKASDQNGENAMAMPSPQQEEEVVKKKYGGILPKKKPLISKDHERAFFDSADWALGKQGAGKPKGPLEALRPKLQPSPHHNQVRLRRSAYAPADDCDVDGGNNHTSSEDENNTMEAGDDKNTGHGDQSCHN